MNLRNIFKSWKTSVIGLFCLIISGAYPLVNESAGWQITAIFLIVGVVLILSPDKAKKTIDKAMDKAGDEVDSFEIKK